MNALDDRDESLPGGIGYRDHARFAPPLDHPCMASVIGQSGWRTARRLAADVGMGGLSVWLSPTESGRVVVGEQVTVELDLDGTKVMMSGVAAHVHTRPGSFWVRKALGVKFDAGAELDLLEAYLKRLRAVGARRLI